MVKPASHNIPAFETLPLGPALVRDLRSDHAGEIGAVEIYRGILAVSRHPAVRDFARHHEATEREHRAFFDRWLPPRARTRARPLWRAAGWVLGAVSALFGPRAVFCTIAAVETFVDDHYRAQVDAMAAAPQLAPLRDVLAGFREEEIAHRDDAAGRVTGGAGLPARAWGAVVAGGSALGVVLARRL
ncbi:MAG: demethoxyubiquinone hydroxylase family protein [Gammaproteobacteria bacterium]